MVTAAIFLLAGGGGKEYDFWVKICAYTRSCVTLCNGGFMTIDDYKKVLLDSSFKEANLFWVRNSAFFVVQALLLGFVLNLIKDIFTIPNTSTKPDEYLLLLLTLLKILGLIISIFHFIVILFSRHYNLIWFNQLKQMLATSAEYDKIDIDKNFHAVLSRYECIHFPRINVITFTGIIPILFFAFWIVLLCK